MIKHIKKVLPLLALTVCLLLSCIGCSQILSKAEDKELRGYTESLLDAIAKNKFSEGYRLVDDCCTEAEFEMVFNAVRSLFTETESYKLELLHISKKRSLDDGVWTDAVMADYLVTIGENRYVVKVATHSNYEQLAGFHITAYEQTDYYKTGLLNSMKDATAIQWLLLLSNLISIAVVVIAIVDACRRKIKYKPLWIIIILLCFAAISVTYGEGQFQANFNVGTISAYSALIRSGIGTTTIRVLLPAGSIIYFIFRKRIIVKPVQPAWEEQPVPHLDAEQELSDTDTTNE